MLRNVLADYLDRIREREFDLPFMSLLPSLGFYDIHFTHGQVEFGKDFIAKRIDNGVEVQYSFQSKAGDINQADWRNDIMGQILEAVVSKISHPQFDKNMPHQSILVTTGRLKGNAAVGLQDLNTRIIEKFHEKPIVLWDKENLLNFLESDGLTGVHQATAKGLIGYGQFYLLYGKSLQSEISDREIERFSHLWIDQGLEHHKRILRATIEAEVIATKLLGDGLIYEAVYTYLGVIRVILYSIYDHSDKYLEDLYKQSTLRIYFLCKQFFADLKEEWRPFSGGLLHMNDTSVIMMGYLVICARSLELISLYYLLEEKNNIKQEIATFLRDFINNETGCAHSPSDRYAISIVLAELVLCHAGLEEDAKSLIQKSVIWLCDRYEEGCGLAPLEADEYLETITLLGYQFDFPSVQQSGASFLASAICDLAAFIGDENLYTDVVNDIKASKIYPIYWQAPNTKGIFTIESEDIISYPNIQYNDSLTQFSSFEYAEHIAHEPQTFDIIQKVDSVCLIFIALLLRDRYFPTTWPVIGQKL